jgi:hypothetical protein
MEGERESDLITTSIVDRGPEIKHVTLPLP